MKTFLLLTLVLLTSAAHPSGTAAAQPSESETVRILLEARAQITDGWHRLDRATLAAAAAASRWAANDRRHAALAHYYAGLATYHQVGLVQGDRDAQLLLLNEAIAHLEAATNSRRDLADAHALLAAALGRKVMLQPASGFLLGGRINGLTQRAMRLEPDNPRVVFLNAIGIYNRPAHFGGSRERGLAGLQRAAALFEREAEEASRGPLLPVWGREEAYAWIGLAHLDAGRLADAEVALQLAVALAPDYGWVRHVLMPRLAAAMSEAGS